MLLRPLQQSLFVYAKREPPTSFCHSYTSYLLLVLVAITVGHPLLMGPPMSAYPLSGPPPNSVEASPPVHLCLNHQLVAQFLWIPPHL